MFVRVPEHLGVGPGPDREGQELGRFELGELAGAGALPRLEPGRGRDERVLLLVGKGVHGRAHGPPPVRSPFSPWSSE